MRKLVWAGLIAVGIVVALLSIAALSLNRIVAEQRDHILAQASAALGREVTADRIALNLWSGLGVRVDNLRVGEDPRFGQTDFARADMVVVHTKVLPLLHGRVEVARIQLTHPQVQLIRDAGGQWNYASLKGAGATPAGARAGKAAAPSTMAPGQLPLAIGRANIDGGMLIVIDRSRSPEQTTRIDQIDLGVSDVSADHPVTFDLRAALGSATRNLKVRGVAGPLAPSSTFPLQVDGTIGPIGPQALQVDDFHLGATVAPASVQFPQLTGRAFGGAFQLTGTYPLSADGAVALKGELSDVALARVLQLAMQDAPQRIGGTGKLELDLQAAAGSADAMRASLAGQVAAHVQNGVIKDFNLVNEVLGRLTNLPKIGDLVSRRVKPKYAHLFSDPDTRLRRLHATFRIADQRMHTDDLAVEADDFGVRGAGWIGFDRDIDLTGTLAMSPAFTRDVVADVKDAKYLVDDQARLALPFRLRGKIGQARPEPDTSYLVTRLSEAIAPGAVKDLVQKLFGGKTRQEPAAPKESKPDQPLEQRLRDLLGR